MAGSSQPVLRIYVGGWRSDIPREDCGYICIYILLIYVYTFYRCNYVCTEMNMFLFVCIHDTNKTLNIARNCAVVLALSSHMCSCVLCIVEAVWQSKNSSGGFSLFDRKRHADSCICFDFFEKLTMFLNFE